MFDVINYTQLIEGGSRRLDVNSLRPIESICLDQVQQNLTLETIASLKIDPFKNDTFTHKTRKPPMIIRTAGAKMRGVHSRA
jgi:hypothetical protein